jgi:anhydro-N-acetylmuramic acid kinase
VFHEPALMMSFQMGDGAAIAATTGLPVVSDLRNMDIALGGQGAPIVPIGEKLLWRDYTYFLNIGGICNVTINQQKGYSAFDVCPANRVLNLLAKEKGLAFDEGGQLASKGKLDATLLNSLNQLDYYTRKAPKSLSNEFGTMTMMNIFNQSPVSVEDKMCTMTEHIALQLANALQEYVDGEPANILITGGGAFNKYLIERIKAQLQALHIEVVLPDRHLIEYKEALVMALIGILRWREESNVIASVTGASRNSVGGALWMGHD